MKKFAALFLTILITWICIFPTLAINAIENKKSERIILSSLSYEECLFFLASKGVTVPIELEEIDIIQLIGIFERKPNIVFDFENKILLDFCEDVRKVINEYYEDSMLITTALSEYTLQYSTLYQTVPTPGLYNCYAYALGVSTKRCIPGEFSGQTYNGKINVSDLAQLVIDDLQSASLASLLNRDNVYNCILQQDNRPSSLATWENVIAVRKETTYFYEEENDFHFVKLDTAGWLHKPDNSHILKLNDLPNNNISWTSERYTNHPVEGDRIYDSDIIYILYKTDHIYTYTWTGEHYHSGKLHWYERFYSCDCGETYTTWESVPCSGPPCSLITSIEETPITE